jgi:hypothetical protein
MQSLPASTMQNYRRHIKEHLLPYFNDLEVGEINRHHVEQWERQERGRGWPPR